MEIQKGDLIQLQVANKGTVIGYFVGETEKGDLIVQKPILYPQRNVSVFDLDFLAQALISFLTELEIEKLGTGGQIVSDNQIIFKKVSLQNVAQRTAEIVKGYFANTATPPPERFGCPLYPVKWERFNSEKTLYNVVIPRSSVESIYNLSEGLRLIREEFKDATDSESKISEFESLVNSIQEAIDTIYDYDKFKQLVDELQKVVNKVQTQETQSQPQQVLTLPEQKGKSYN